MQFYAFRIGGDIAGQSISHSGELLATFALLCILMAHPLGPCQFACRINPNREMSSSGDCMTSQDLISSRPSRQRKGQDAR